MLLISRISLKKVKLDQFICHSFLMIRSFQLETFHPAVIWISPKFLFIYCNIIKWDELHPDGHWMTLSKNWLDAELRIVKLSTVNVSLSEIVIKLSQCMWQTISQKNPLSWFSLSYKNLIRYCENEIMKVFTLAQIRLTKFLLINLLSL